MIFLGDVFWLADLLVEAHVEQQVGLLLARGQINFELRHGGSLSFGNFGLLLHQLGNDFVRNGGFKCHPLNHAFNLGDHGLFTHAFLRTWRHAFGATQIIVTFLGFNGDEATAFATAENATIEIRLQLRCMRFALALHDFLHLIEQVFGNDRLMDAFMAFAVVIHQTKIKWVLEHHLII